MAKVEYNMDNCMKCRCPDCPVQAESKCISAKRPKWEEAREEMMKMGGDMGKMEEGKMAMKDGEMEEMGMMDPKDMIGMYCSLGKSSCTDLDAKKRCSCPNCMVWKENNLESQHYCTKGDAEEIG